MKMITKIIDWLIKRRLKQLKESGVESELLNDLLTLETTDRSNFYIKPLRFGEQSLYENKFLRSIDQKQWESFALYERSNKGKVKIGDVIYNSTSTTVQTLVDCLDKIKRLPTASEEIHLYCNNIVDEVKKEIKLR